MFKLIYIAAKNVFRNRRRTAIMLMILSFSGAVLIVYAGFADYVYWGFRESLINADYGHIQIYKKGFLEADDDFAKAPQIFRRDLNQLLPLMNNPNVSSFAPRIYLTGLASNGEKTVNFFARGVQPEKEMYLSAFVPLKEGVDLVAQDFDRGVVGALLAKKLNAKVGDYLTLVTTTANGAINAMDIEIIGIYESGSKYADGSGIILPLRAAQMLLATDGMQRVVVQLDKTENTGDALKKMQSAFDNKKMPFEAVGWDHLAEDYHKVVAMYSTVFNFMFWILAVICILSITNTFLMSVFERTREIGTIRALGSGQGRVMSMFLLEGVFLGLMGGVLGVILGVLFAKLLSIHGIYMPPPPGYSKGYMIYINLLPSAMLTAIFLSVICAVLASLYAAYRASRLQIVEALRYV